ncbi:MAG: HAMP domain-containing protein [Pseudomonadales bacterium]|nr:HAMP domain-containing protein [Pseudomonadales bacterium]
MSAIADGDLSIEVEGNKRKDELGSMTNALIFFIFVFRENKRISTEPSRVNFALRNAATAIMMLDEKDQVIFTNNRLNDYFKNYVNDPSIIFGKQDPTNLEGVALGKQFAALKVNLSTFVEPATETLSIGERHLKLIISPVIDEDDNRLGTVIEWHDLTETYLAEAQSQEKLRLERQKVLEEQGIARENSRIRQSLDGVTTGVAIINSENRLVYGNDSLGQMLRPMKTVQAVLDMEFGVFGSSDRSALCNQLRRGFERQEIVIEDRVFLVNATPVCDVDGQALGTTLEWVNKTTESQVEKEIDDVISQASCGDLENRITLTDKSGFFLSVSEKPNSLLDSVSNSLFDTKKILDALAVGNLEQRIQTRYQGTFGEIAVKANQTADNLQSAMGEVEALVKSSSEGRLKDRITIEGKEGFFSSLSFNLNNLIDSVSSSLQDTQLMMEALATGNLNHRIEKSYQSTFGEIATKANQTADNLKSVMDEAEDLVASASKGELSTRMATQDKAGFFIALTDSLNQLMELISGTFDELGAVFNQMAEGNLTARITGDYGGDFGEVKASVNKTATDLSSIIKEIQSMALSVVLASEKIAKGNIDLSNRTEQQATTLEQTSAGIDKLKDSAESCSSEALEAGQVVKTSMDIAEQGKEVAEWKFWLKRLSKSV